MEKQTVSVLIPTFNRAGWLIEALDSILAQTRLPDEIIVINDGSTDDTEKRLEPYLSRIQVITQPNAGKAAALNRAMSVVKGNLIWVFDDDDIAEPEALEILTSLLKANPEAAFAYGRHDRFRTGANQEKQWMSQGYWIDCSPEEFLFQCMLDMFVHQPAMLIRKNLYNRAGPFEETFIRSQDYEMLLRLAQHGKPVSTDRVVFHQRVHDKPRGSAGRSFSSSERNMVWQQYDKLIFEKLFRTLTLGRYLPDKYALTAPNSTRRALLRRGIVMARKNLWNYTVKDFQKAAQMTDVPLSPEEVCDLRKTFTQKYDYMSAVLDPATRKQLESLKHTSRVGAQISRGLARALVWRVRRALQRGNFLLAFRFVSLIIGLVTPVRRDDEEFPASPLVQK